MPHLVWDWNGTLFDDLHLIVDAVNACLTDLGEAPIDADDYRTHYGRPVNRFYERLLGRPLARPEWQAIDDTFHAAYRSSLDRAHLTADACDALAAVRDAGHTQSLLSMWWHDELVPFVARFAVDAYMVRIDGNRRVGDDTKAAHLEAHVSALRADLGTAPANGEIVVVGDALDDARAAAAVGVRCVLYDGGSHHRAELDAAGVPVAGSLCEAVRLAGVPGEARAPRP